MLQLGRVCIPVGLACNMECIYCYRHVGKTRVNRLNDLMRRYLEQLDPTVTKAVVASGGEPLLYLDRVKEIFSHVHKNIHLKLMSNGLLLTEEIVEWMNENNIELHFSHDGEATKRLRLVDVLDDERIRKLLVKVKTLRVNSTICAGNEDVIANYKYIAEKLEYRDFYYTFMPFFGYDDDALTKNFDYDLYMRSYLEFLLSIRTPFAFKGNTKSNGLNVLPDGRVCGMANMKIYGTVENTLEEILAEKRRLGDFDKCESSNCPIHGRCKFASQSASKHACKCMVIQESVVDYLDFEKRE